MILENNNEVIALSVKKNKNNYFLNFTDKSGLVKTLEIDCLKKNPTYLISKISDSVDEEINNQILDVKINDNLNFK